MYTVLANEIDVSGSWRREVERGGSGPNKLLLSGKETQVSLVESLPGPAPP